MLFRKQSSSCSSFLSSTSPSSRNDGDIGSCCCDAILTLLSPISGTISISISRSISLALLTTLNAPHHRTLPSRPQSPLSPPIHKMDYLHPLLQKRLHLPRIRQCARSASHPNAFLLHDNHIVSSRRICTHDATITPLLIRHHLLQHRLHRPLLSVASPMTLCVSWLSPLCASAVLLPLQQ